MICLIQDFEAESSQEVKESQPQNPELRNNPENIHPSSSQVWHCSLIGTYILSC